MRSVKRDLKDSFSVFYHIVLKGFVIAFPTSLMVSLYFIVEKNYFSKGDFPLNEFTHLFRTLLVLSFLLVEIIIASVIIAIKIERDASMPEIEFLPNEREIYKKATNLLNKLWKNGIGSIVILSAGYMGSYSGYLSEVHQSYIEQHNKLLDRITRIEGKKEFGILYTRYWAPGTVIPIIISTVKETLLNNKREDIDVCKQYSRYKVRKALEKEVNVAATWISNLLIKAKESELINLKIIKKFSQQRIYTPIMAVKFDNPSEVDEMLILFYDDLNSRRGRGISIRAPKVTGWNLYAMTISNMIDPLNLELLDASDKEINELIGVIMGIMEDYTNSIVNENNKECINLIKSMLKESILKNFRDSRTLNLFR